MEHDHHLTTRAPVVNRPAHGIPTPRSQRAMGTHRVCQDCSSSYHYTHTHTNPRYCARCLPGHTRTCQVCKQSFPLEHDTDRLCPVHATHPALF